MENINDSLDQTAHAFGMTDLEFEERSQIESEIASQQVLRRWQEEEEADRKALKSFPNDGRDFDFGFHDQLGE